MDQNIGDIDTLEAALQGDLDVQAEDTQSKLRADTEKAIANNRISPGPTAEGTFIFLRSPKDIFNDKTNFVKEFDGNLYTRPSGENSWTGYWTYPYETEEERFAVDTLVAKWYEYAATEQNRFLWKQPVANNDWNLKNFLKANGAKFALAPTGFQPYFDTEEQRDAIVNLMATTVHMSDPNARFVPKQLRELGGYSFEAGVDNRGRKIINWIFPEENVEAAKEIVMKAREVAPNHRAQLVHAFDIILEKGLGDEVFQGEIITDISAFVAENGRHELFDFYQDAKRAYTASVKLNPDNAWVDENGRPKFGLESAANSAMGKEYNQISISDIVDQSTQSQIEAMADHGNRVKGASGANYRMSRAVEDLAKDLTDNPRDAQDLAPELSNFLEKSLGWDESQPLPGEYLPMQEFDLVVGRIIAQKGTQVAQEWLTTDENGLPETRSVTWPRGLFVAIDANGELKPAFSEKAIATLLASDKKDSQYAIGKHAGLQFYISMANAKNIEGWDEELGATGSNLDLLRGEIYKKAAQVAEMNVSVNGKKVYPAQNIISAYNNAVGAVDLKAGPGENASPEDVQAWNMSNDKKNNDAILARRAQAQEDRAALAAEALKIVEATHAVRTSAAADLLRNLQTSHAAKHQGHVSIKPASPYTAQEDTQPFFGKVARVLGSTNMAAKDGNILYVEAYQRVWKAQDGSNADLYDFKDKKYVDLPITAKGQPHAFFLRKDSNQPAPNINWSYTFGASHGQLTLCSGDYSRNQVAIDEAYQTNVRAAQENAHNRQERVASGYNDAEERLSAAYDSDLDKVVGHVDSYMDQLIQKTAHAAREMVAANLKKDVNAIFYEARKSIPDYTQTEAFGEAQIFTTDASDQFSKKKAAGKMPDLQAKGGLEFTDFVNGMAISELDGMKTIDAQAIIINEVALAFHTKKKLANRSEPIHLIGIVPGYVEELYPVQNSDVLGGAIEKRILQPQDYFKINADHSNKETLDSNDIIIVDPVWEKIAAVEAEKKRLSAQGKSTEDVQVSEPSINLGCHIDELSAKKQAALAGLINRQLNDEYGFKLKNVELVPIEKSGITRGNVYPVDLSGGYEPGIIIVRDEKLEATHDPVKDEWTVDRNDADYLKKGGTVQVSYFKDVDLHTRLLSVWGTKEAVEVGSYGKLIFRNGKFEDMHDNVPRRELAIGQAQEAQREKAKAQAVAEMENQEVAQDGGRSR